MMPMMVGGWKDGRMRMMMMMALPHSWVREREAAVFNLDEELLFQLHVARFLALAAHAGVRG